MSKQTSNRTPRSSLNLRIKPEERDLIDKAAQIRGQNRTDFILEAARNAAEETLLEQTLFLIDPDTYEKFLALLDASPQPSERLRKTIQTPAPWDIL
jgi:uncharacterized protein (DUF1778 family)